MGDAVAAPAHSMIKSIAELGIIPAGVGWSSARGMIQERLVEVLAAYAEEAKDKKRGFADANGPSPMAEDGAAAAGGATGEESLLGAPPAEPSLTTEELCLRLSEYGGPPFTIQRLCELLLEPRRHYRTRGKLAYACGKLLSVNAARAISVVAAAHAVAGVLTLCVRGLAGDGPDPAGSGAARRAPPG